ncbi:hypothetical protein [Actinophytocola xinjiangensis]|uniref:hypothetical protein n=1 Tax=Actinophytocola xinjiangensis TaxID=485602 RepID=UPI0012B759E0|nr:hypothetical protein [Actinophytocola xinjiangensis]
MVGAIASVLVGLALATGVAVAVSSASAPDKNIDLNDPATPNNFGGGNNTVNYGSTAP